MTKDHPIFTQSIQFIKAELGVTGLNAIEQQVLERLIHTSGDFSIQSLLKFSPYACQLGIAALKSGAPILTDTSMAMSAILPMGARTINPIVKCILDWAPKEIELGQTRSALGMKDSWIELSKKFASSRSPVVVIGSAPTALEVLLDLISDGFASPSLIIGMPVGFIGVNQSKNRLAKTLLPHILLNGTRGGAAMAASVMNSLLRASIKTS